MFRLFLTTFLGTVVHFIDNYVDFDQYQMYEFSITPWMVPVYWLVMTPIGISGYNAFTNASKESAEHKRGYYLLYLYCALCIASFAHYYTRPIWAWTTKQNVFILGETLPASALLLFTMWLHVN